MLLGSIGYNNSVTSLVKNILYCFLFWESLLLRDRKSAVLESSVVIKVATTVHCFFSRLLQVSILCASMGEQNDLANDAREGPFRSRWISLLGTLSKRQ